MTEVFDTPPNVPQAVEDVQQDVQRKAAQETVGPRTRRLRTILFEGILIAVLSLSGILALLAKDTPYFGVDLQITRAFQAFDLPGLRSLMVLISLPGYAPQITYLTLLIVVLVYWLGLRWESVALLAIAIVDLGVNTLVKFGIARPRPAVDLVDVFRSLGSYSFPSGHVMFYTGFFGFLFFLSYTLLKPSWRRSLLLVFFGGLVMLVGPSRIYLGAHWPSDVLGAYMLGGLSLVLGIQFYHWGKPRFFTRQPVAPETAARTGKDQAAPR